SNVAIRLAPLRYHGLKKDSGSSIGHYSDRSPSQTLWKPLRTSPPLFQPAVSQAQTATWADGCSWERSMTGKTGTGRTGFELTEEQEELQRVIRRFAQTEIAPHVREWDDKCTFPSEVVRQLGQMGLLGVIFPPELGGSGMGYVEYVLAIEELSRVDG